MNSPQPWAALARAAPWACGAVHPRANEPSFNVRPSSGRVGSACSVRAHPLALDAAEHQLVLDTLNSERFADTAPAAVHATLLDEGRYLGSVRTMYRVLAANGGTRERRNQRVHPAYVKPELLAVAPNQVWSWDITKLKGPVKWTCFHLYVILDCCRRPKSDPKGVRRNSWTTWR